jgi:hypothetical protein
LKFVKSFRFVRAQSTFFLLEFHNQLLLVFTCPLLRSDPSWLLHGIVEYALVCSGSCPRTRFLHHADRSSVFSYNGAYMSHSNLSVAGVRNASIRLDVRWTGDPPNVDVGKLFVTSTVSSYTVSPWVMNLR